MFAHAALPNTQKGRIFIPSSTLISHCGPLRIRVKATLRGAYGAAPRVIPRRLLLPIEGRRPAATVPRPRVAAHHPVARAVRAVGGRPPDRRVGAAHVLGGAPHHRGLVPVARIRPALLALDELVQVPVGRLVLGPFAPRAAAVAEDVLAVHVALVWEEESGEGWTSAGLLSVTKAESREGIALFDLTYLRGGPECPACIPQSKCRRTNKKGKRKRSAECGMVCVFGKTGQTGQNRQGLTICASRWSFGLHFSGT